MPLAIEPNPNPISYTYYPETDQKEKLEETEELEEPEDHQTEQIIEQTRKFWTEKSAGYQEPDDTVTEIIFKAKSEHGDFIWRVTSRRSGFESFNVIEDVELIQPPKCEIHELPSFEIIEDD